MSHTSDAVTLESLRAKTDRDLIVIIDRALERGLDLLRAHPNGNPAEQYSAEAERAYALARKLLPVVHRLTDSDRHRLQSKLAELGSALDRAFYGPNREVA